MTTEAEVIDSAAPPAATDATPPSSEATQVEKPADSTPATTEATKPETVSEALSKVVPEKVEVTEAEKTPESGEDESKAEAIKDEPAKAEDKPESSLDIRFDKRPEWAAASKALGKDFDKVKPVLRELMTRETKLNERITQIQPLAQVATDMERQCGGKEGFQGTRRLLNAFNDNPAEAVPMLETLIADARKRAGLEISSPDLIEQREAVEARWKDGLIDDAERDRQKKLLTEAETGRATVKRVTETKTAEAKQQQERDNQAQQAAKFEAINAWESNARKTNPDFGNVTPMDDPKHGESVGDQVFDAICLKFQNNPNATSDQLVQEAERVLKLAKGRLQSPALRASRPVTSQGSSVTAKPKPKTLREALDQVPAERTA